MDSDKNNYRKTVAFAKDTYYNPSTSNYNYNRNYNFSNSNQNFNNRQTHTHFNAVNQVSTGNYVRPSFINTTYNLSSSQVFANPSNIIPRNPSVVVRPDTLIKIEIFNPDLNGTRNRHISARLALFIRSLNTYRVGESTFDNSFVNGGVWAKPFQNRSGITVVINGIHVIESFPLTIFNEDPNWNYVYEMRHYRKNFIHTLVEITDFDYLKKFDI